MLPEINIGRIILSTQYTILVITLSIIIYLLRKECIKNFRDKRQQEIWIPLSFISVSVVYLMVYDNPIKDSIYYTFIISTWYKGSIVTSISFIAICTLYNIPILKMFNLLSPLASLAYAIMRIGCFLAGDGCFGRQTDFFLSIATPNGIIPRDYNVHLTPLYESIIFFLLFVFLVLQSIS